MYYFNVVLSFKFVPAFANGTQCASTLSPPPAAAFPFPILHRKFVIRFVHRLFMNKLTPSGAAFISDSLR